MIIDDYRILVLLGGINNERTLALAELQKSNVASQSGMKKTLWFMLEFNGSTSFHSYLDATGIPKFWAIVTHMCEQSRNEDYV